jgi:hypothetical protein
LISFLIFSFPSFFPCFSLPVFTLPLSLSVSVCFCFHCLMLFLDDGLCQGYTTMDDCFTRKSIFEKSRTYCVWDATPDAGVGNCSFNSSALPFKVCLSFLYLCTLFLPLRSSFLSLFSRRFSLSLFLSASLSLSFLSHR